jgi:carboxyl-terminal processing protease
MVKNILKKPFDFFKNESIELDAKKRKFSQSQDELREYWRKILKYQCLLSYLNIKRSKGKKDSDDELFKLAKQRVFKSFESLFNRLTQATKKDSLSLYLKALIQVYDPHSEYFPPKEKQDFDIEMTGTFEGIGAALRDEDGLVKVVRIIIGGPSWRQKRLKPGDFILKVAQGDKEPVDIVGMRTEDAVKLIRGKKGTEVRLTVKKPDGSIVVIPIIRDVVVVEESYARSAVFKIEGSDRPFGYIYLPRFYRDFSRRNGKNSTDDIKKEIKKLQSQEVEGIILDLRNNSGGSLIDAITISGLFITEGPIVQIKDRQKGIQVLRDEDENVNYAGPLLILINTLSASASEIMAAALQDYGRAVIMGGEHSFGKGTVQVMFNLDRYLSSRTLAKRLDGIKSLGALKITIQKFYRITGSSNQFKGVVPDIILPDYYDYLNIGEKYLDYPLDWDSIPSVSFTPWGSVDFDLKELARKSESRVKNKSHFQQLKLFVSELKKIQEKTEKSLNLKIFLLEQKKVKQQLDKIGKSPVKLSKVLIFPSEKISSNQLTKLSGLEKEKQEISLKKQQEWFKQLQEDFFLEEATLVMNDMVEGK